MALSMLEPLFKWILALHVMAFTSWMAGLFYLPRLFVYHVQASQDGLETPAYRRFCVMERKLFKMIMVPASVATLLTGGIMASIPGVIDWNAPWWWTKLIAVFALFLFQFWCRKTLKDFADRENIKPERYFRLMNEVPTLLMTVIVVMIIVRP